jgi:hypothetical protein
MTEFEVTYNTNKSEIIEADSYTEHRGWIIFQVEVSDEMGLRQLNQEILRLKGSGVKRVERLRP